MNVFWHTPELERADGVREDDYATVDDCDLTKYGLPELVGDGVLYEAAVGQSGVYIRKVCAARAQVRTDVAASPLHIHNCCNAPRRPTLLVRRHQYKSRGSRCSRWSASSHQPSP